MTQKKEESKHDFWIPEYSPVSILERSDDAKTAKGIEIVSQDELARWRRKIIRILDQLAKSPVEHSGLASRIWQLSRNGVIPREVASLMQLIAEMRNVTEYEEKVLSASESQAVRNAWSAIVEWALPKGLQIPE